MRMSRRTLLATGSIYLFFAQFAPIIPFFKNAPKKKFLVDFATIFAQPTSPDQYKEHTAKYMDRPVADRILSAFHDEKKILYSESYFTGESNHWFVLFDGEESYREWCVQVDCNRAYYEDYYHLIGFSRFNRGTPVTEEFDFHATTDDAKLQLTKAGKHLWTSHV